MVVELSVEEMMLIDDLVDSISVSPWLNGVGSITVLHTA